jgi:FkbM family methyltransferase
MNIQYLGTEYGGWAIDLDEISDGDVVIDAGLGEDISFLEDLNRTKKVEIIGVDPTEKSHLFVSKRGMPNLTLIKKAIAKKGIGNITMFKNTNPNYVSESYCTDHSSVGEHESYEVECVSILDLIKKYGPSLIKLDIEGGEYDVLEECIGVKQVCVEFHHHCIESRTENDMNECLDKLTSNGYKIISSQLGREFTLLKFS